MMFFFKRRDKALEVSILNAHLQSGVLVIYRRNIHGSSIFLLLLDKAQLWNTKSIIQYQILGILTAILGITTRLSNSCA